MADILKFRADEFEVLETFTFEEKVERSDEMRFFTLEQQLQDYFEKLLPRDTRATKFELKLLAQEVNRYRKVYDRTIGFIETDYKLKTDRSFHVDWVHPIYKKFKYTKFNYENYTPLISRESRHIPNFYPKILVALPLPYNSAGKPIETTATFVDQEGKHSVVGLQEYRKTRNVIRDNGETEIVSVAVEKTSDNLETEGFYLEKRKLGIPYPLKDHPFLNAPATKILTSEPLKDIFPTVESIVYHAVPTTTDPYGEGLKYLKVFDVKLNEITWDSWKQKFPEVEEQLPTDIKGIVFESHHESTPSPSLQSAYVRKWNPGLAPRFWLSTQEDGGLFVIKMLLSKSSEYGILAPNFIERPAQTYPESEIDDCFVIDTFDSFLQSGVYRKGVCVPATMIQQERTDLISQNRLAWKETTETDILKEHQELLKFQRKIQKEKEIKYEKIESKQSELRKTIISILENAKLVYEDKFELILKFVETLTVDNERYLDKDGLFVVCKHTLAELRGDLEYDRLKYYNKWSIIDEGFRVCKFCAEQINADVTLSQAEFDEFGQLIVSSGEIEGIGKELGLDTAENSLVKLKKNFLLENAGESTLYLLLSLLQIVPQETQLLPFLQYIRNMTATLRKNKFIPQMVKEKTECLIGITGAIFLILVHNPFLIPRRSIKNMKLDGYPRDSDDETKSNILNTIISLLKQTFEAFPTTFSGPILILFREIMSNAKGVYTDVVVFIKQGLPKFKVALDLAKERYVVTDMAEVIQNQLKLPLITEVTKQKYKFDGINELIMMTKIPPYISPELKLLLINPKNMSEVIIDEKTIEKVVLTPAKTRELIGLGFPSGLKKKLKPLADYIETSEDSFGTLLSRLLDLLPSIKKQEYYRSLTSDTRDATRGLVYEILHSISTKDIEILQTAIQKDLVFSMLLITAQQATRETNVLRSKEKELFKNTMRNKTDQEREILKKLFDIGIGDFIVSNRDRELFAQEYGKQPPDVVEDQPQESGLRDYGEQGDVPLTDSGIELQVDYGSYGDRLVRDYDDYGGFKIFNDEE